MLSMPYYLCHAVACDMLCCAVLCYAVVCCAGLCCAMLRSALLCTAMLCSARCHAMICYALPYCAMLSIQCCAMLCCAVLYYAMLCYAMLSYGMLSVQLLHFIFHPPSEAINVARSNCGIGTGRCCTPLVLSRASRATVLTYKVLTKNVLSLMAGSMKDDDKHHFYCLVPAEQLCAHLA